MTIDRRFFKYLASTLAVVVFSAAGVDARRPARTIPPPASQSEKVVDRLGVPGPIVFNAEEYTLAWSSDSGDGFHKQEYVRAGESVGNFSSMIMIDLRPDGADAMQMAKGIASQIVARGDIDPVANYDIIVNPETKEVIIDFLMSANGADGTRIVEWSAYRYATQPDGTGTTLLGIARRGYGDAAIDFLKTLKAVRQRDIDILSKLNIEVTEPER